VESRPFHTYMLEPITHLYRDMTRQTPSWLSYKDCTNLYGGHVPAIACRKFRVCFPDEIAGFDLMSVPSHGDTGYIVECELQYPHRNFMTSIATTPWRRNISPSRQICLVIYVMKLKLKIGNPCKNSFPNSWIKPTMSATIVTHNFISNTLSF